jgi:signal transduction histidine kinase
MDRRISERPLSRLISCTPDAESRRSGVESYADSGLQFDEAVHDLRNLLLGADLMLQSALDETHAELPAHSTLKRVQSAFREARNLCREMLDRHNGCDTVRSAMQPLDLGEMLVDLLPLLRSMVPRKASFHFEPERDLPLIMGDRVRLHRAVLNLVRNSAEAIGDGAGAITVRTGVSEVEPRNETNGARGRPPCCPGPYACVEVSDTGCGMDQSTIDGLFRCGSPREIGHGLGLLSVQEAVAQHQGLIEVSSSQLGGTTIRLLLPV